MLDYLLTNRKSLRTPAEIKRKVLEADLVNAFHWLPHEIDQIPYKRLQELLIILELKSDAKQHQRNVEAAKQEAKGISGWTPSSGRRGL